MDNSSEYEKNKWNKLHDVPIDEDTLSEALAIFNSIEKRANAKNDFVNWDERSEMEKAYKRSGHLIKESGDNSSNAQDTTEGEKDLMDYLGGVMNHLEGPNDN